MVNRLILKDRLDSAAAEPLRDELVAAQGTDIVLDASAVAFLGGLCLELMMCARQVWADAGHDFTIDAPSDAFTDNLSRFGLTPGAFSAGGAA